MTHSRPKGRVSTLVLVVSSFCGSYSTKVKFLFGHVNSKMMAKIEKLVKHTYSLPKVIGEDIKSIKDEIPKVVKVSPIPQEQQQQQQNQPTLSWSWYNQQQGVVQWTITNPTNQPIYAVIYRNGYTFGSAFTEVYLYYGIADIWTNSSQPPQNPYSIALIQIGDVVNLAFVFYVPANSQLSVLEAGFSTENPPQDYQLILVQPESTGIYEVSYIPVLPYVYSIQSNELVLALPSTYFIQTVTFTNSSASVQNPFPRTIIGIGFLLSLLLNVLSGAI